MAKVGILTCSNTTQDVGCSSFLCLKDVQTGGGFFRRYNENGGAQLVGIINCAGCPTAVAPEKILKRVRSLTFLGVDAIHVSACVVALCPFKNKYIKLLKDNFPNVEIVEGTHEDPPGVSKEMFVAGMVDMLTQPQKTMADLGEAAMAMMAAHQGN